MPSHSSSQFGNKQNFVAIFRPSFAELNRFVHSIERSHLGKNSHTHTNGRDFSHPTSVCHWHLKCAPINYALCAASMIVPSIYNYNMWMHPSQQSDVYLYTFVAWSRILVSACISSISFSCGFWKEIVSWFLPFSCIQSLWFVIWISTELCEQWMVRENEKKKPQSNNNIKRTKPVLSQKNKIRRSELETNEPLTYT